jgi:protease-4
MKKFFKYVFATMLGIVLMSFIGILLLVITMFAGSNAVPDIKTGSVLELKLSGNLVERSEVSLLSTVLGGSQAQEIALDDVLESIAKAKDNQNIEGILLQCGFLAADYASLEEIRSALNDFRQTGKFVLAYGDNYTQRMYYLASVADSIFMNPKGTLELKGLASRPMFYKGLLDKLGIEMQVLKVGSYKSFAEQYTDTVMSEANREQTVQLSKSIWYNILGDISDRRGIPLITLNAFADRFMTFESAEKIREHRLVDSLVYYNEMTDYLNSRISTGKAEMVKLSEMTRLPLEEEQPEQSIAVVYLSGEIDDSDAGSITAIHSPRVVKMLEEIRQDSLVKAVVLRINSPGGSAYGSEQIWHAVNLIAQEKPVIASMGGVAASGGYYIATAADTILAQSTTITGSIGVFGIIPNAGGLAKKVGINFDVVKTNPMADFPAIDRPLESTEQMALQSYIERTYALFISRTAAGRKMNEADVEQIAQGHVWSGMDAMERGLIDRLGSLQTAIDIAKARVKMPVKIEKYPKEQENMLTSLLSEMTADQEAKMLSNRLGEYAAFYEKLKNIESLPAVQARMPFDIIIR